MAEGVLPLVVLPGPDAFISAFDRRHAAGLYSFEPNLAGENIRRSVLGSLFPGGVVFPVPDSSIISLDWRHANYLYRRSTGLPPTNNLFTTNAVLKKTFLPTMSADAVLKALRQAAITADAVLQSISGGSGGGAWPKFGLYNDTNVYIPLSYSTTQPSHAASSITNIARVSGVVAVTTSSAHGLVAGEWVEVSGVPTQSLNLQTMTVVQGARTSGIARLQTSAPHNMYIGALVNVETLSSPLTNNGWFVGPWIVTAIPSSTEFEYAQPGYAATASAATNGLVRFSVKVKNVLSPTQFTYDHPGPDASDVSGTVSPVKMLQPAQGDTYTDPTFGSVIKKLFTRANEPNKSGGAQVRHYYSTISTVNSDGTLGLLYGTTGGAFIVSMGTTQVVRLLSPASGQANQHRWSHTDPGVLYYRTGAQLRKFTDVRTGTANSLLRDFSPTYTTVEIGGPGTAAEGELSPDGDVVPLILTKQGGGRVLASYRISTDAIIAQVDVSEFLGGLDNIHVFNDGSVHVNWQQNGCNLETTANGGAVRVGSTVTIKVAPNTPAQLPISSITRAGNVVTVNVNGFDHRFRVGSWVRIGGVTDTSFNGDFQVTANTGSRQFQFSQTGADASSSGGTANGHGYQVGDKVRVFRVSNSEFNGLYTVLSVPDPMSFTYTSPNSGSLTGGINISSATGGKYQGMTYWKAVGGALVFDQCFEAYSGHADTGHLSNGKPICVLSMNSNNSVNNAIGNTRIYCDSADWPANGNSDNGAKLLLLDRRGVFGSTNHVCVRGQWVLSSLTQVAPSSFESVLGSSWPSSWTLPYFSELILTSLDGLSTYRLCHTRGRVDPSSYWKAPRANLSVGRHWVVFASDFADNTLLDSSDVWAINLGDPNAIPSILLDSALKKNLSGSFVTDAHLVTGQQNLAFTLNAVLQHADILNQFTLDSVLKASLIASFFADGVLSKVALASFLAESVLKKNLTGNFRLDAALFAQKTGLFSVDASLATQKAAAFIVDAALAAGVTGSFSVNARLYNGPSSLLVSSVETMNKLRVQTISTL